jgi:hypothetical protein
MRHRMAGRCESMTPEEKKRFRQRMRERWGFGSPSGGSVRDAAGSAGQGDGESGDEGRENPDMARWCPKARRVPRTPPGADRERVGRGAAREGGQRPRLAPIGSGRRP